MRSSCAWTVTPCFSDSALEAVLTFMLSNPGPANVRAEKRSDAVEHLRCAASLRDDQLIICIELDRTGITSVGNGIRAT